MAEDVARGAEGRPAAALVAGWRRIVSGTARRVRRNKVDLVASSVAFWAFLALFPAIAAVLAMSAWVLDPGSMRDQLSALTAPLPEDAEAVLNDRAAEVASRDRVAGVGALIAIAFAIWTASAATKTLMGGLNAAAGEAERRGFLRFNAVAIFLTTGMFAGFILSLVAIVVVPATLAHRTGLGWTAVTVDWLRWPVMALFAVTGLATLYRYGPSRRNARWRWVSIGTVASTALWILVSLAFSIYVGEFAAYNRFYGTLGGVAVLMIWFWLSAWIVLAGAELNAEIEAQRRRDMSARRSRVRAQIAALRRRRATGRPPGNTRASFGFRSDAEGPDSAGE
jgi:membrane protein